MHLLLVLIGGVTIILGVMSNGWASQRPAYDPLAQDIMSDEIFMDGMWHMAVEDVQETPKRLTVTTTGALFQFSPATDRVLCSQRLGKERRSLLLRFPEGSLSGLKVTAQGSGAVILQSDEGMELKVNCDSLLMMRAKQQMEVTGRLLWSPAKEYDHGPHRLLLDPYGAVGLFPINDTSLVAAEAATHEYTYQLPGPGMLWASIGPPRPYEWERSLTEEVIWTYAHSERGAVPTPERVATDSQYGNILWLQSEVMLWRSWQSGFVPRLPEEFAEMVEAAHEHKLRVIIYASPFYFVKGTPQEEEVVHMAPNFQAAMPALTTTTGENVGWYLEEAKKALDTLGIDGLYFDGVYRDSVKNNYILLRATRELLGDERLLFVHNTVTAPGGLCYNPAADTWADFHLRGEQRRPFRPRYLRWYVSGYNISNSIGFVCNNAGYQKPTREQVEMTLEANCRLPYISGASDDLLQPLQDWYWPRLNESYRAYFEELNERPVPQPLPVLEQPTVLPPLWPLPGLTEAELAKTVSARLMMDTFGVGAPKYTNPMTLNGVPIGIVPCSNDAWAEEMVVELPPEVCNTLKAENYLVIENPDNDCFKLRNVYLDVALPSGARGTSNLIGGVYCSDDTWAHAEGESVTLGKPLRVRIPFPVQQEQ